MVKIFANSILAITFFAPRGFLRILDMLFYVTSCIIGVNFIYEYFFFHLTAYFGLNLPVYYPWYEGLIVGHTSVLMPNMASKNDEHWPIRAVSTRCHVWHRFLTPCLASKSLFNPLPPLYRMGRDFYRRVYFVGLHKVLVKMSIQMPCFNRHNFIDFSEEKYIFLSTEICEDH